PAVKWFPPKKTGLIAGIVVSGFGLASVYAAPLAKWLTGQYGVQVMMRVFGVAFVIVVVALAQLLEAPHRVRQFLMGLGRAGELRAQDAGLTARKEDFTPGEMLRTWQFYVLWFMYACGAGAGLMVISVAKKLGVGKSIGALEAGTIVVVTLAIGNGAGRIVAGMLSDKLGRRATMAIFFVFQAVMVILLALSGTVEALGGGVMMAVIAALVGANYGANLALFPSTTKDYYGLKGPAKSFSLDEPRTFELDVDAKHSGTVTVSKTDAALELRLLTTDPAVIHPVRRIRANYGQTRLIWQGDCWELFFDFRPPEERFGLYGKGTFHVLLTPPAKDLP
ncbi:hypothetical protein LCGC14_3159900, partial [marine sediment metagenome]